MYNYLQAMTPQTNQNGNTNNNPQQTSSLTTTPQNPQQTTTDPFAAFLKASTEDKRCVTVRTVDPNEEAKCLREEKEKQQKNINDQ